MSWVQRSFPPRISLAALCLLMLKKERKIISIWNNSSQPPEVNSTVLRSALWLWTVEVKKSRRHSIVRITRSWFRETTSWELETSNISVRSSKSTLKLAQSNSSRTTTLSLVCQEICPQSGSTGSVVKPWRVSSMLTRWELEVYQIMSSLSTSLLRTQLVKCSRRSRAAPRLPTGWRTQGPWRRL